MSEHDVQVEQDAEVLVFPASFAQQRLWFLERLHGPSAAYHMPFALRFHGPLSAPGLQAALTAVVERHESLRTRFEALEGEPCQLVHPPEPVPLPVESLESLPPASRLSETLRRASVEAARPFDLGNALLLRARLYRLDAGDHVLLVVQHHLVSDGWSLGVFAREVAALYAGQHGQLGELPLQYADYSEWQREWLEGPEARTQLDHWRQQLAGVPPAELPADRPRPAVPTGRGATLVFELPVAAVRRVRALAQEEGATTFMVFLAAFQALLHRHGGQESLVVGTVSANRSRAELEGLIGLFVNTLAVPISLAGDPPFRALLGRVRRAVLDAFANQELPFDRVVEAVRPERAGVGQPLFNAMFVMEGLPIQSLALGAVRAQPLELATASAKFDLTLSLEEAPDRVVARLEYAEDLFRVETVQRLADHYVRMLDADPSLPVSQLPLADDEERGRCARLGLGPAPALPAGDLVALFDRQVRARPGQLALIDDGQRLTYAELDARARSLAAVLRARGVGADVRVGLCAERSVEAVIATLAILQAGGAYVPLDPAQPEARLGELLEDTTPALVLIQAGLVGALPGVTGERRLTLAPELFTGPPLPSGTPVDPAQLAYVMFTSGSTGRPKGVAVPHRAVVRLVVEPTFAKLGPGETVLQFAPAAFDASTLEVWGTLCNGATLAVCGAGAQSVSELARFIRRHAVTTAWLTAGLFQEFVEQELPSLAGLRQLLTGGDVVSPAHVQRALRAHPGLQITNGYGPTEATTFTCTHAVHDAASIDGPLPLGRPIGHTSVLLVDGMLRPAPLGAIGELCVGGAGLARGYLGRAELTAERFIPHPEAAHAGERLYRTGDLARWLPDGTLQFLGRADQQVKIRGFRIELGELEDVLRRHLDVRDAAVVVGRDATGKRLVAHVVAREGATLDEVLLREHLRGALPEYMLPAGFVLQQALPLGPTGKVDRAALQGTELRGFNAERVAPRTPTEEVLCAIWAELLERVDLGVRDDFFELGGHSLLATRLLFRVRERLGVELPLRELFEHPTIEALAARLARAPGPGDSAAAALTPADRSRPLPLSSSQQRLYFLDRLEGGGSAAYNIHLAVRLTGPLDVDALTRGLDQLVLRHEALRTTLLEREGEPYQVISAPSAASLERLSADTASARELLAERINRPFRLAQGPLFRAHLLTLGPAEHVLALVMHHAVSDGWSLRLLVQELSELYAARLEDRTSTLAPPGLQFADYAVWQRAAAQDALLEPQLGYWRERLAAPPPPLLLPADRPRPARKGDRGGSAVRILPSALQAAVGRFARERGTTSFTVLLAVYKVLLLRLSGQADLVVGAPVSGRTLPETEGMVGFFANTVALRTAVDGALDFTGLVERVRTTCLEAFAHQEVPFDRVVEALQPERSTRHTPIFQVMIAHGEGLGDVGRLGEVQLEAFELPAQSAAYDLTLSIADGASELALEAEYDADLFEPATVAGWLASFEVLLRAALARPELPIEALPVLDADARTLLLRTWNRTDVPAVDDPRLHGAFESQARRTPEAVAVVAGSERLTYAELAAWSGRVSRALRAAGVGRGARVGLCVPRTVALPAALLGTLRAGAAFVPLDPDFPEERLALMGEDAGLAALLVVGAPPRGLELGLPVLDVTHLREATPQVDDGGDAAECGLGPADLAYVIYTSGSTGRPKGVVLHHGGAVNLLQAMRKQLALSERDVWLAVTTISFDIAVAELLLPLSVGGTLVLVERAVALDAEQLEASLEAHGATVMQATPSTWSMLIEWGWKGRPALQLLSGGEALPPSLAVALRSRGACLWNYFGPTETTIWSTAQRIEEGPPTIGRPLDNTTVYLLDEQLEPVPRGAVGHLFLGGAGVAHGYHARPDLTAERFIPDPFAERPGARLYRTGDLARQGSRGELEWLGRSDFQVKIRGFRIEIGEVEGALRAVPGVRDAAVATDGTPGATRLVAYVVPTTGGPLLISALRDALGERLPAYMIPSLYVPLDALPRTLNGKLDRKRLPAPGAERAQASGEDLDLVPGTPAEATLQALVRELLGVPEIGLLQDFFELGGDSLWAMRLCARARALGHAFAPADVFRHPNVRALAAVARAVPAADRGGAEARGDEDGAAAEAWEAGDPAASFPLTPMQRAMLFHAWLSGSRRDYAEQLWFELPAEIDLERLASAWRAVIAAEPALRTSFHWRDGDVPLQRVSAEGALDLRVVDTGGDASEETAERLAGEERARGFTLERLPLLRLVVVRARGAEPKLLLTYHHLILDGWSVGLLCDRVVQVYRGETLTPIRGTTLGHYQRWLEAQPLEAAERYFRACFREGARASLLFGGESPRLAAGDVEYHQARWVLEDATSSALSRVAAAERLTLGTVLQGAWALLLSRHARSTRVQFGAITSGRSAPLEDLATAAGMFINILPVVTRVEPASTWTGWLRELQEELWEWQRHEHTPLASVQRWSGTPTSEALFESLVVVDPHVRSSARDSDGLLRFVGEVHPRPGYPLQISFLPGRRLGLELTWQEGRFTSVEAESVLAELRHLLERFVEAPQARLGSVELLPPEVRRRIIEDWNRTGVDFELETSFTRCFEAQARRSPAAVALSHGTERVTYAELDRRASGLAHQLRAAGVAAEAPVVVLLERGAGLVTVVLAILKAGGVYLPLDPRHPPERWAQVLRQVPRPFVVVERQHAPALERVAPPGCTPWCLESLLEREAPAGPLADAPLPESLAYVIHTSGSTGVPKGAMIHHRGMLNHLWLMVQELGLGPADVVAQTASACFDISVWQLLNPLLVGGRVHVISDARVKEPAALLGELEAGGVTVAQVVPSLLRAILEDLEQGRAQARLGALRWLIPTGEALPSGLADAWLAAFPRVPLLNAYGPAECSDDVTLEAIRTPLAGEVVSIGRPVANHRVYVLDAGLMPTPVGVEGELYVGGLGVGRGYWADPQRSADRFLPDPFSTPGARMYRSGDLVRQHSDGRLVFVGRVDFQVKLRGYRIELEEIETRLRQEAAVSDCVVVAHGRDEDVRLAAYFTLHGAFLPERGMALAESLRQRLTATLPEYMVPTFLVPLERMPLNANGKIDRKALPAPAAGQLRARSITPPRDAVEQALVALWQELLGVAEVGVHDGFFELGGQSMLALRLMGRIERQFGVRLRLDALFESPTLEALAERIRARREEGAQTSLVQLRAGTGRPVFLVHPVGGHVLCYRPMLEALRTRRPVYGLRGDGRRLSLEERATAYLEAVRATQPEGPYALAGWSMGGVLAYEMARQLEAGGLGVEGLVAFDSLPATGDTEDVERALAEGLASELGLDLADAARLARARDLPGILALARREGGLPAEISDAEAGDLLELFLRNAEALSAYRPGPYAGSLVLLEATEREIPIALAPAWRALVGEGLTHQTCRADHFTLMSGPAVVDVAAALDRVLGTHP